MTPDFRRLLGAQLVSVAGTQVTMLALPTLAVLRLHAGATATSALLTAEFLPATLAGPFIGVLVDRAALRRVLVLSDVARALVLATVPVAAALGRLSLAHIFVVAALVGLAAVPFDTAASTAVPHLVPDKSLPRANSLISAAQSVGRISGPGLGGLLVAALGAATAILVDVASYGASAALLATLRAARTRERPVLPRTGWRTVLGDARAGLAVVRADPVLARGMLGTASLNLGGAGLGGLYLLYAYHRIGLSPAQVGVTMTAFSVGSLLGALLAPAAGRWLGPGNACLVLATVAAGSLYLIPAASGGQGFLLLTTYEAVFAAAATGWVVLLNTLRQQRTPGPLLGRVSALARTVTTATFPAGTAMAALAAATLGLVPALYLLCAVASLTPLWYLSPRFRYPAPAPQPA